ncbi:dynamin family protein [Synechocystis sp. PCC 7339]|uniref:dynamin family protein n=2 Tax=unclassified Synechocystis TaxID=2640012 RepID=UPI00272B11FC|nr:dynamin family protein [Synechocystis sp. PCC 7339]UAJ74092.1 dynamin family protein [Synechocystis sp. PCC 7339]
MDIEAKLSQARSWLDELGNAISDLVGVAPEVFEDEKLKQDLADFRRAYDQAVQDLANPSLRIAMIGTTSSGKSTIVNALIGRRIAPIEAGEMSGGVLRIKHGEGSYLKVEETEGAAWETGEWSGLSDEEIYNRIQRTMHTYHEVRRKADYIAPQIEVKLPILPACNRELSGLPEGLAIEFVDLPGLKSIQDRGNLQVIQSLVGKAFCLVALDYGQVDEVHRQKLLGELKQIIDYFDGKTDSMIFILNRVDNRKSDDIPLESRIAKLSQEIKENLKLSEYPDIIPFSANILYQAQCAWGINNLKRSSLVAQTERLQRLRAMFSDCSSLITKEIEKSKKPSTPLPVKGTFKKFFLQNQDLKSWFRYIEDRVREEEEITDEMMQTLVKYALLWSGGNDLWSCIRSRINNSFEELVVNPILMDIYVSSDVVIERLNLKLEATKGSNEEIELKIQQIKEKRPTLREQLREKKIFFISEINNFIEDLIKIGLSSNDDNDYDFNVFTAVKNESSNGKILMEMNTAIKYIQSELNTELITKLLDAFEANQPSYDLEDELGKFLSPPLAKSLARSYDTVSRLTRNYQLEDDLMVKSVSITDQQAMEKLREDEHTILMLYENMYQAIKEKTKFLIQAQEPKLLGFIEKLFHNYIEELCTIFDEIELPIKQNILADWKNKTKDSSQFSVLPEDIFNISGPIFVESKDRKKEFAGTESYYVDVQKTRYEQYTETYKKKFLFFFKKDATRTSARPVKYIEKEERERKIFKDIEYRKFAFPKPIVMARQWSDAVESDKMALLNILKSWLSQYANQSIEQFEIISNEALNFAEISLNERLNSFSSNLEQQQKFLESIQLIFYQLLELKKEIL